MSNGESAGDRLVWAVKNGDLPEVQQIIEQPASFKIDSEILNGRNSLHYAADYGQKDVIVYLITKGANVNTPDKHGITPLLAAIYEEHVECVKILLEKGADKSGKAPDGNSYSASTDNAEIKALLN